MVSVMLHQPSVRSACGRCACAVVTSPVASAAGEGRVARLGKQRLEERARHANVDDILRLEMLQILSGAHSLTRARAAASGFGAESSVWTLWAHRSKSLAGGARRHPQCLE